jgi:exopolysaccharide biosynthesis polyprenyl glycosylphosphotransferase
MKRLVSMTLACDAAALAVAGILASFGRPFVATPPWAFVLLSVSALILGRGLRLYTRKLILQPVTAIAPIIAATALASLVFVLPLPEPDALTLPQTVQMWLLATVALALTRLGLARLAAKDDADVRSTLIVGAGRVGRIVEQRLRREPSLRLNPVGFLDDDPLYAGDGDSAAPVLGGIGELERVVCEFEIQHVLVAFSKASDDDLVDLVRQCETLGVTVAVVPRLFELAAHRRGVRHLGCIPLVGIRPSTPTDVQVRAKDLVDRVVSVVLIVVFAPVLAIASAAVLLSLGRPVFFRQRRLGKDGRTFEILKLRTMKEGEVGGDGAEESYRCTAVGAFLRRASLDELPQLFNILRGEMSLIGPRPERPELVADFRRRVYRYDERHRVKGGISGWAQVHGIGRGEDRFVDAVLLDRAEWDNFYIEHWSPWLELKILFRTFAAVWRFRQESSGPAAIDAPESATEEQPGTETMGDPTPALAEFWLSAIPAGDLIPVPEQAVAGASAGLADGPGPP